MSQVDNSETFGDPLWGPWTFVLKVGFHLNLEGISEPLPL